MIGRTQLMNGLVIAIVASFFSDAFVSRSSAHAETGDIFEIIEESALGGELEYATRRLDALAASTDPQTAFNAARLWARGLAEAGPLRRPRPGKALTIYRRLAQAGGRYQARALFELYEQEGDPAQREMLLRQAVSLGHPPALLVHGTALLSADDQASRRTGAALLQRAAAEGEIKATFALARASEDGLVEGGAAEFSFAADAASSMQASIEALEEDAKEGRTSAMRDLADLLETGKLADQDSETAETWLNRAAEAGDVGALLRLARGATSDEDAAGFLRRAIERGSAAAAVEFARLRFDGGAGEDVITEAEAALRLKQAIAVQYARAKLYAAERAARDGEMRQARKWVDDVIGHWSNNAADAVSIAEFFDPEGGPLADKEKALLWYRRASDLGSTTGMTRYAAFLLEYGADAGAAKRAIDLLRRAIKQGGVAALVVLGEAYERGLGQEADAEMALSLYEQAASAGSASAKAHAARVLYSGSASEHDQRQAFLYWRDAAAAGNVSAMTSLARALLAEAGGADRADRATAQAARRLLERAAESGRSSAMTALADFLMSSALDGPDVDTARLWLRRASEAGRSSALVDLAKTYLATEEPQKAVKIFEEAAAAGSVESMVELARAYALGVGASQDGRRAIEWLQRADTHGVTDPKTLSIIGRAYIDRSTSQSQIDYGLDLLEQAADAGRIDAMTTLARYYEGEGPVTVDDKKRFDWYLRAADAGSVRAMLKIGTAYGEGRGVAVDNVKAFEWLNRAVEAGSDNASALIEIGRAFSRGVIVRRDTKLAFQKFLLAAERGSVRAMELVARAYQRGEGVEQKPDVAIAWYQQAAVNNSTKALNALGRAYASGYGVNVDLERAFQFFLRAANKGSRYAMSEVARFIVAGVGVNAPLADGIDWYRRAAEAGDLKAMIELSSIYRSGFSVEPDDEQSVAWLERAVEGGSAAAMYQLASAYLNGEIGLEKDKQRAVALLNEAAKRGDRYAKRLLQKVEQG